jgi:hypothetical protein
VAAAAQLRPGQLGRRHRRQTPQRGEYPRDPQRIAHPADAIERIDGAFDIAPHVEQPRGEGSPGRKIGRRSKG